MFDDQTKLLVLCTPSHCKATPRQTNKITNKQGTNKQRKNKGQRTKQSKNTCTRIQQNNPTKETYDQISHFVRSPLFTGSHSNFISFGGGEEGEKGKGWGEMGDLRSCQIRLKRPLLRSESDMCKLNKNCHGQGTEQHIPGTSGTSALGQ